MTTPESPAQRPARRAHRASATVSAVGLVAVSSLLATPAHADVPEGWSNPADVDLLEAVLLLVGGPLLLFVVISLAVYLPALVRGEKVRPGAGAADDQWFGGPRPGSRELPAAAESDETGGARGTW